MAAAAIRRMPAAMTPAEVLTRSRRSDSSGQLAISNASGGTSGRIYGMSFESDIEKNTKTTMTHTQRKARDSNSIAALGRRQALASARAAGRIHGRHPAASTGMKNQTGS